MGDPPTAASTLTVTDAPGTPTIKKNAEKRKFLLRLLMFTVIFSWVFSGGPQIFNFPPLIQEALTAVEGQLH